MINGAVDTKDYMNIKKGRFKKVILTLAKVIAVVMILYLLLITPIFFMYPNIDEPVRNTFDKSYFIGLSDTLRGDCKRKVQNFMLACPFPTREVHLNSDHTIVEIQMYGKWYAFDPTYNLFFRNNNIIQISFDIQRGYIPKYLKSYKYLSSLTDVKYYHNYYFIFLKYICPFYDDIMRLYYSIL